MVKDQAVFDLDNKVSILDMAKMHSRRTYMDCPHFDGFEFLGWHMKIEQFFDAIGIKEEDKMPIVMIHLEGRAS